MQKSHVVIRIAIISLFMLQSFIGAQSFASDRKPAEAHGEIINPDALVYSQPDFDSPVMTTVQPGLSLAMSTKKFGAFFKVRLPNGKLGYVADTDIRGGNSKNKTEMKKKDPTVSSSGKRKSFGATRYRGIALSMINYTEDTMGKQRSDSIPFYGIKWSGPDTVFDGDVYTDANLLFHFGAPSYYSKATGNSANGMILIANFLWETTTAQTRGTLTYFGFGPQFRYSHFETTYGSGAGQQVYSLDDMTLGAVFNVGLAFQIGTMDLRADFEYMWEKAQYYSFGLSYQWAF